MAYETKAAERRGKLRDALIESAERAIEREGLRGVRARDLAAEVDCAVGAIYNAVADLDELIFAVNARTLAALEADLTATQDSTDTPDDAIAQLVRLALTYVDFAATHRQRWRAIFGHQPPAGREIPHWYMSDQFRLFGYIELPLRALLPDIRAARRALLARSLFSAVHGMVALGLEEKLQTIPLDVLREQVATVVTAMGKGLDAK